MQFETERLIIRKPIPEDAIDCFNNYTQDPEVSKYLTWTPHKELKDTQKWINFCIENYNMSDKPRDCYIYSKNKEL